MLGWKLLELVNTMWRNQKGKIQRILKGGNLNFPSISYHFVILTFPSFDEDGRDVFIYNCISFRKYIVAQGLMCSFRANKILLTVFTANWFPWQWKSTCKKNCNNFISVFLGKAFEVNIFFKCGLFLHSYGHSSRKKNIW